MPDKKEVNNPIEVDINRSEFVLNQTAGTLVFNNTTGQNRVQLTHKSGANLYMNDKVFSTFSPGNTQALTKGDQYTTTNGNSFEMSKKSMEKRAFGDYHIITGSPNHFRAPINESYIEALRPIAVAKTAPERQYPAISNNTNVTFEGKGKGNPDGSGAVDGGDYPVSELNIQEIVEKSAENLTELEAEMGEGGNIKMESCKHVSIIAGTTPTNFDSGIIIVNGRSVGGKYKIDGNTVTEEKIAVPVFEEKDTSSTIPFGDVHIKAMSKMNVEAGSGGIDFNTSGNAKLTTSGRLTLGGSEVMIGGGHSSGGGRVTIVTDKDVFIESDSIITSHAPVIRSTADEQFTVKAPTTVIDGDVVITGRILALKDIDVPNGDVEASSISLVKHIHTGDDGGNTSPPR